MQFLREHRSSRVLVNLQPEAQGTLRYFFEPFCGAYYYFSAITVPQACGLMGWIIVIVIAGRFSWCAQFRRLIPQIFGLGLLALVFYCLFIWLPLRPENTILNRLLAPIIAVIGVLWLVYGKVQNKKN